MKLAVISFTRDGSRHCRTLTRWWLNLGYDCKGYILGRFFELDQKETGLYPVEESLGSWTGKQFQDREGIIFIGAAGIAVRAIAPFLLDKRTDPAVVVVDVLGKYAIPILSGHAGGANALAAEISDLLGAQPVITTATDLHHVFAVDVFAREQGLLIQNWNVAKCISADLLDGKPVGFYSDYPLSAGIPNGFTQKKPCDNNLWITCKQCSEEAIPGLLKLVPKVLVVGIGCKLGVGKEILRQRLEAVLEMHGLMEEAVAAVGSIDRKAGELGIIELAQEISVPFCTFTAAQLSAVAGCFAESGFVKQITGVGNVCERAALLLAEQLSLGQKNPSEACNAGAVSLVVPKQTGSGVAIAIAELRYQIFT